MLLIELAVLHTDPENVEVTTSNIKGDTQASNPTPVFGFKSLASDSWMQPRKLIITKLVCPYHKLWNWKIAIWPGLIVSCGMEGKSESDCSDTEVKKTTCETQLTNVCTLY